MFSLWRASCHFGYIFSHDSGSLLGPEANEVHNFLLTDYQKIVKGGMGIKFFQEGPDKNGPVVIFDEFSDPLGDHFPQLGCQAKRDSYLGLKGLVRVARSERFPQRAPSGSPSRFQSFRFPAPKKAPKPSSQRSSLLFVGYLASKQSLQTKFPN